MLIYTIGDVIGLFLLSVIFLGWLVFMVIKAVRQAACKHERVSENSACDAICYECDKNLGFIGAWRERQKNR